MSWEHNLAGDPYGMHWHKARRVRYRFTGRAGGQYYWESVLPVSPGDSRHEQISCPVDWFWRSL